MDEDGTHLNREDSFILEVGEVLLFYGIIQ